MQPANFTDQKHIGPSSPRGGQVAQQTTSPSCFHHLPSTEEEQKEFVSLLKVEHLAQDAEKLTEITEKIIRIQWTPSAFLQLVQFTNQANEKKSPIFSKIIEAFEKNETICKNLECQSYLELAVHYAWKFIELSSSRSILNLFSKLQESQAVLLAIKNQIGFISNHLQGTDENFQVEMIALFGRVKLDIAAQRRIVTFISLGIFHNSNRILESFIKHIMPKLNLNDQQIQDCFFCTHDAGSNSDSDEESSSEERSFLDTLFNSASCTLDEKISLMELFFQKLKEHPNINFFTNPIETILSDVFCDDDISAQLNNPHITAQFPETITYLNRLILVHFIEHVKDKLIRECPTASATNFFLYLCKIFFQNQEISLSYNSMLNQIKHICKTEQSDETKNHFYHNIYLPYLNHISPNTINGLNRTLNGDGTPPDGEELSSLLDELYIFVSQDGTSVIACDHDYHSALMDKQKPTSGFTAFYLFQKDASGQIENISIRRPLEEIFSQFPLLNNTFQFLQRLEKFENFFHALNLEDFYDPFMEALKAPKLSADKKLIDDSIQLRLGEIFGKHLVPTDDDRALLEVNDEFLNSIYTTFDFHEKTDNEKSQLLLLVSTIFLRLSSKFYFGTEDFSPETLRHIGLGLLNMAKKKNDALISDDAMTSLRNRIAAKGTSFECTELISNELLLIVKQSPVVSCYIPIAWM